MANIFERGAGALFGWVGAKKSERQAKRAREEQIALIDRMDWDPMYASENAPTYQKTQSPVARAYLESILTGSNPDTTWEGSTNAAYKKAAQQRTQDNLYGTMPERVARQAEVQQQTPWKVEPPARVVGAMKPPTGPLDDITQLPDYQLSKILRERGVAYDKMQDAKRELIAKYGSTDRALRMVQEGKA